MTREEIYTACLQAISMSDCLLLESATGTGKTKVSIDLVNNLCATKLKDRHVKMLLLVAKRVHKVTWREEFEKWGGVGAVEVITECYESLHKHLNEHFDILLLDEAHHIGSEARLNYLKHISFDYLIGLSATIPKKLKTYFRYKYHSEVVSCDIIEAIEDEILPEPEIVLFPLQVENSRMSETIELNPKAKGPVVYGEYKDYWKLKRQKVHAILKCTQKQKLMDLDKTIEWYKTKAMSNPGMKQTWLYMCGKRLEFLADCKLGWVKMILKHLENERTITFCKTIEQCEEVGKNCIHSKNAMSSVIYNEFNKKEIDHITAVNILNENANLVDCKYAIFCNLSSSEVCMPQRLGRSMRHKSPVIIIPYYPNTREQEILEKYLEGFNKEFIRTIHSINEI